MYHKITVLHSTAHVALYSALQHRTVSQQNVTQHSLVQDSVIQDCLIHHDITKMHLYYITTQCSAQNMAMKTFLLL